MKVSKCSGLGSLVWIPAAVLLPSVMMLGCGEQNGSDSFGGGESSSTDGSSGGTTSNTDAQTTNTTNSNNTQSSITNSSTATTGASVNTSTNTASGTSTSSSSNNSGPTSSTSGSGSSSSGNSSANSTSSGGFPGGGFAGGGDTSGEPGSTSTSGSSSNTGAGSSLGGGSSSSDETTTAGPVELDCNAMMPTSGAEQHSGNGVGGEGNLAWDIWSNTGQGELTTYDVPAFSAIWNEAGGYLGRLGFEWGGFGDNPGPYTDHGTITAQFVSQKTGTAGQYSYVGMYGWSTDPCVEWYVVEDSFNMMPINPGTTTKTGEVDIDGGTYIMYTRPTQGTGGSRCDGVTEWMQYYSVRTTARSCGEISLTEHFDAWAGLNMPLGALLEAKILAEVGGGTGRVDFPIANVMTSQ